MDKKEKALRIVEKLKEVYPESFCMLGHEDPFQLLVAVRLSAQCTDERVNMVTPQLFARFPDVYAMASADPADIESFIRSCGLFKTKARDIKACAVKLRDEFGGKVPESMESLLSLPGVGRKSANLIRGDIYGLPAIVTDTHCIRISGRLGLVDSDKPEKVEKELLPLIPPAESSDFCHRLVFFGREYCRAQNPCCKNGSCPLRELCERRGV